MLLPIGGVDAARWRDIIKIHPAAELFPMGSEEELTTLSNDIAANGLRQGITLWTPADFLKAGKPRHGESVLDWSRRKKFDLFLLDGRNRLTAIERIADPEQRADKLEEAFDREGYDCPPIICWSEVCDPYKHVVSLNLYRRHLTRAQKRELIEKLLQANPERSDRETTKIAKVDHKTAGIVRAELAAAGEIPQLEKTVGADGKARRPRRTISPTREAALREPAAQVRAKAISGFSTLLHRQLPDTLEDLARILRDERDRIAQMPLHKRLALARAYLGVFGIALDDLRAAGGGP